MLIIKNHISFNTISQKTVFVFYCLIIIVVSHMSCKKFLDVGEPVEVVSSDFVFNSNASAAAVLTGILYDMQTEEAGFTNGRSGISFNASLSADELSLFPTNVYTNTYHNVDHTDFWSKIYKFIFEVNSAIEGISSSAKVTGNARQQLLGESYFIRAFCYFYLVNLYGDVPLLLTTDYKTNAKAKRESVELVYGQIVADLEKARDMLSDNFLDGDASSNLLNERVRPTSWAATALLSRAFLYTRNWSMATEMASVVIENHNLFELVPPDQVFLKNSREAIWQLQTISSDGVYLNPLEARLYVILNNRPNNDFPFWLGNNLLSSFEPDDDRFQNWVDSIVDDADKFYYPFKYRKYDPFIESSEYLMVLRLAELYLIRAEARLQLGDLSGAKSDVNIIRNRAGLDPVSSEDPGELLDLIINERRIELFTEWGHRWFDLKRWEIIDDVMPNVQKLESYTWMPFRKWFPIPINDLKFNSNLVQNEGYPIR